MTTQNEKLATRGGWRFDNTYLKLPEPFYVRVQPEPVREPGLVIFNHELAGRLGLDAKALSEPAAAAVFVGRDLPEGSDPIAQAYAGHQFGHFTMLGDGRAILLGEHLAPDDSRWDIQLKGPGRTPYSRRGDGRAALGPMLREYVISEAMHALGIPTTRSLAVATTGEMVAREEPLPGAILTRVAASHLRVGTFEYAAGYQEPSLLATLTDYTLRRHFPGLQESENPALALLDAVIQKQAALLAQWQLVGFVHGVMNTDNMALSGETIDYGPCAFMDTYHPDTVFSSIDRHGRYAYKNQPPIAQWNLARLAESLLPLLDKDQPTAVEFANASLARFPGSFEQSWLDGMRAKLGLFSEEEDDSALISSLLHWMLETGADYINTLRALNPTDTSAYPLFAGANFQAWHARWRDRLGRQDQSLDEAVMRMRAHHPEVVPRNHHVEAALQAASEKMEFSSLHKLLEALKNPYESRTDRSEYLKSPPSGTAPYQTFCGT